METRKEIIFRDDDVAFSHVAHYGEDIMEQDFLLRRFIEIDYIKI